jgi:hypothetical protein
MKNTKMILIGVAIGIGVILLLGAIIFVVPQLLHSTQQSVN